MKKNIAIEKLIVNPENYRFDPVDSQSEAIDLMLEEKGDEIANLAKHVFEYGLDEAKDLRVLEIKKNLYHVLDGNRRVTAIKCLQNPSLVKSDSLRNKFIKIKKGKGLIPNTVNSFVYTNEAEAAEWIKLDHTGKNNGIGQDDWELAAKDRFDFKFGGKVSPATKVLNFFQHETNKAVDTKTLKMSTVNRILSNPESRSYLGIDIKNSDIVLRSSQKEVVGRLDQLFNKIMVDDVAVKEVYHTPDSIKFMKNLFGDKPKLSKATTSISPKGVAKSGALKSVRRSASRNVLIPKECVIQIYEQKINNIYFELRTAPLNVFTNAIGVLFRVFLETSLDCYAHKYGMPFADGTKLAGKITKICDGLERSRVAERLQLVNVRSVTNKGNSVLSIDNFHQYVHSFKTQPVPVDLIYKWDNLQEFFIILWAEIKKKSKP